MKLPPPKPRNFGLDLLRVLAMAGILFSHSTVFKIPGLEPPPYPVQEVSAVFFVMIFFALSGYLFGEGCFRNEEGFSFGRHFLRRAIRILPVYYAALISTWLINHRESPIPWRCFFLIQNYKEKALGFMPVAWSLCVEEWSYLILALVFLLLTLIRVPKDKRMLIAAAALIAVSILVRIVTVCRDPFVNYDFGIRKQTFSSMDSFGYGILAAWLERKQPAWYRRFFGALPGLLIGGILIGLSAWGFTGLSLGNEPGIPVKIFGFTGFAVGALCLVLVLKDLSLFRHRFFTCAQIPNAFLSKLTYPLYLIHFQFYIKWSNYCQYQGIVQRGEYILRAIGETLLWSLIVHLVMEIPLEFVRKKLAHKRTMRTE
ncbi:MAG: acyltransferase [Lachnospiraceae bacterium]|nr:acyltransferase [Lachnospiraceae bacterium]